MQNLNPREQKLQARRLVHIIINNCKWSDMIISQPFGLGLPGFSSETFGLHGHRYWQCNKGKKNDT